MLREKKQLERSVSQSVEGFQASRSENATLSCLNLETDNHHTSVMFPVVTLIEAPLAAGRGKKGDS